MEVEVQQILAILYLTVEGIEYKVNSELLWANSLIEGEMIQFYNIMCTSEL